MFKQYLSTVFLLVTSFMGIAQEQISWRTYFEPANPIVGQNGNLVLEGKLQDGWHIYATQDGCNGTGPLLTELKVKNEIGFKALGKLKGLNVRKYKDKLFDCEVWDMSGTGVFKLPILYTAEQVSLSGTIDFMVCKDEVGCIPLDHVFSATTQATSVAVTDTKVDELNPLKATPETDQPVTKVNKIEAVNGTPAQNNSTALIPTIDSIKPSTLSKGKQGMDLTTDCGMERKAGWDDISITRYKGEPEQKGLSDILLFIFGAFLAGLVTVVTPCVFPMLPMTVTFFTKSNSTRSGAISQALIYGLSIVGIYTLFGVIVGRLFGEEFASALSTNWVVNLVFFGIFVLFALSFLGMFEITLPNSLVNKVDAKADKGGLVGTFFMAFALVLVSFSCTGPIVGSIMLLAAQGEWIVPTLTMLAFSVAFALPFTLMAIFPGLMSKLPKSGGWLNSVKVVLGLLELGLSLKFLSQADQVKGWGILDREVFLVIWIAVFMTIALYLFGKLRFSHDDPTEKISAPRGVLAIGSLAFAVYLVPGLFGAPLKSLSGIFPPMSTQDFVIGRTAPSTGDYVCGEPMHGDQLHIAHGIKGYFDLRQAICCAKAQNKPLFIDFTGKTCANCRQMEEKVWSDPAVLKSLKEDFVVASLYTDYNEIELPASEHYTSSTGREISTLGKSLQDFQKTQFGTLTLPMYSIVGLDEASTLEGKIVLKELTQTSSYNDDVEAYLDFLKAGRDAYRELRQ